MQLVKILNYTFGSHHISTGQHWYVGKTLVFIYRIILTKPSPFCFAVSALGKSITILITFQLRKIRFKNRALKPNVQILVSKCIFYSKE